MQQATSSIFLLPVQVQPHHPEEVLHRNISCSLPPHRKKNTPLPILSLVSPEAATTARRPPRPAQRLPPPPTPSSPAWVSPGSFFSSPPSLSLPPSLPTRVGRRRERTSAVAGTWRGGGRPSPSPLPPRAARRRQAPSVAAAPTSGFTSPSPAVSDRAGTGAACC